MTEDVHAESTTTKDLSDSEKLTIILAELGSVKVELGDLNQRVARLEAIADDRSRDTQPMLERIHKEIADVHFDLKDLRHEMRLLREDIRNERRERVVLAEQVELLEARLS